LVSCYYAFVEEYWNTLLYCRIGKSRGQSDRGAEGSCNNWPHILLSSREHCEWWWIIQVFTAEC